MWEDEFSTVEKSFLRIARSVAGAWSAWLIMDKVKWTILESCVLVRDCALFPLIPLHCVLYLHMAPCFDVSSLTKYLLNAIVFVGVCFCFFCFDFHPPPSGVVEFAYPLSYIVYSWFLGVFISSCILTVTTFVEKVMVHLHMATTWERWKIYVILSSTSMRHNALWLQLWATAKVSCRLTWKFTGRGGNTWPENETFLALLWKITLLPF